MVYYYGLRIGCAVLPVHVAKENKLTKYVTKAYISRTYRETRSRGNPIKFGTSGYLAEVIEH
jgi:hypothetical protein